MSSVVDTAPDGRILVIGPAWIGDMVLAQSLFKVLKARYPDAALDVVAPAWTAPLLARMPEVATPVLLGLKHGELGLRERWHVGRGLRRHRYEQAIVLPNSFKSAIVPFAARAHRRTGFRGEWRYGLLNDIRPLDRARLPRTVDRFVALGLERDAPLQANLPTPRLRPDRANTRAALVRLGLAPPVRPVLALCPGAEYGPAKRWPASYYAELARAYAHWDVWLFGSANDAAVTAEVAAASAGTCIDLAGRTTLADAIDLLALTSVVVTNDSGLMHVAAALDRPLVAIFGSSDPRHTPPLSARAAVAYLGLSCSPCFARECPLHHLRCLKEQTPDSIAAEVARVRDKSRDTRYK